ncbi:hypothetical protein [Arenimonas sp.]|uniref:hypothetical protein n=1 Tax=Arenimonas sp. TaxID=1872635 RepID=UPI0039E517A3
MLPSLRYLNLAFSAPLEVVRAIPIYRAGTISEEPAMLPEGYRYLGEGSKTSSGPYTMVVRIYQSDLGAYGYEAEADVTDLPEFEAVRATGFGFRTSDDANLAAIDAIQRILEARNEPGR